jgi:hypothetical protein
VVIVAGRSREAARSAVDILQVGGIW